MRYESVKGKHWVELTEDKFGYGYKSNNSMGSFGNYTYEEAVDALEKKIEAGLFLPDKAKTPMKKVS